MSKLGGAAAVALLLGVSPWVGAAGDPKAAKLYEDALTRYEKRDVAGAIIQLKNALQIDRNMLPVHVLLGKALLADSEVVGAEVAFTEALRLGVNRVEVVVPLAQSMMGQGKRQQLLDDPRFATAGLPAGVRMQMSLLLASVHADLGRPREALKAIEEARAAGPTVPDSWLAEVPVRVRARQFGEAAAAADKALALSPGSAEATYLRGSVAHTQGDLGAAVAAYGKALELQPKHLEALLARAGIAIDQNRVADAKRDIEAARQLQPKEPRALYMGAVLADREGNPSAAKAALADVTGLIDRVPMPFMRYQPQLLILAGLSHYGLGSSEKAKPYFEVVQRDQPGSPVAKLLGQIYLAEKNIDRAISALEGYLRAYPTDAQALSMLAGAHMSQGRHARATQILHDALKVQDKPALRTVLGLSLMKSGKAGEAYAELESAFARDPGQIQAGAALVGMYLRDKKTRKAVEVAESLVKRQPGQPGLLNLLGSARAQAGDLPKARAALEQAVKQDPAFVDARLNLARLDIQARQPEKALAGLNEILTIDEKHVPTLIEMGLLAESKGQVEEATLRLSKAADHSSPNDLQALFTLLEFHLRGGRYDAAGEVAKRLDAKAPEDVMVQIANARVALAGKNTELARTHLVKATRLANFDATLQTRIALLQLGAGDAKAAAYSLSKALQGDPGYLPAQALLGDAEVRLGEFAAAEARAREIVARHPKQAVGHALLGDVAAARGQSAAAVEAYRRAHQIEASTVSVLRLHRALALKDPAAATQVAEQWLKANPRDVAVRRVLADGYARAGNMPAARLAYEQLLKVAPNHVEALNNFAHVLLALKDVAGANRAAGQALAAKADAPHIIGTAGWMALKAGQTDRALQLLRDARLRDPANPELRYYLASALASAGRPGEAREELQAALRGGVTFASVKDAEALLKTLK